MCKEIYIESSLHKFNLQTNCIDFLLLWTFFLSLFTTNAKFRGNYSNTLACVSHPFYVTIGMIDKIEKVIAAKCLAVSLESLDQHTLFFQTNWKRKCLRAYFSSILNFYYYIKKKINERSYQAPYKALILKFLLISVSIQQ